MSGIGAIGLRLSPAWHMVGYYSNAAAARSRAANPAQVNTPVEPVQPVKRLAPDAPVRIPVTVPEPRLPTEADLNNAQENLVRMRIQYPTDAEALLSPRSGMEGPDAALENAAGLAAGEIPWAAEGIPGLSAPQPGMGKVESAKSPAEVVEEAECQTCAKRKYQDGSDDPGVSFQTPTAISPERAAVAVRGHEQEHVVRERAAAEREDRKVVSQSVTLHTDICPECGRVYISGGVTKTVTAADNLPENRAAETGADVLSLALSDADAA